MALSQSTKDEPSPSALNANGGREVSTVVRQPSAGRHAIVIRVVRRWKAIDEKQVALHRGTPSLFAPMSKSDTNTVTKVRRREASYSAVEDDRERHGVDVERYR